MHAARFTLVNLAALALLALATTQGWTATVVAADKSRLTLVIAGTLAAGLALSAWRLSTLRPAPAAWLDERVATIRLLIDLCPLLGLLGTVVGFVIAFGSIDLVALASADQAAAAIGGVLAGMGIALYTTLVGILAAVWLSLAFRAVEGRVAELVRE